MKRMYLGSLLFGGGLIGTLVFLVLTALYPGSSDHIDGVLGSLMCMDLVLPFLIFIGMCLLGLIICIIEAYGEHHHTDTTEDN
ncbi:MAG: hypothetical protein ACRCWY_11360 [Cellulosilyticaceae bacterium]